MTSRCMGQMWVRNAREVVVLAAVSSGTVAERRQPPRDNGQAWSCWQDSIEDADEKIMLMASYYEEEGYVLAAVVAADVHDPGKGGRGAVGDNILETCFHNLLRALSSKSGIEVEDLPGLLPWMIE